MTYISSNLEKNLQTGFKFLNKFMLLCWRLGLGQFINAWPKVGGRIMVLTHTGRKTGQRRQTPVNYAFVDGEIYCVAAFGRKSDWYLNIKAQPEVEVWLPQGWWSGVMEEVYDSENRVALTRQVLIASGFAAFAAGINPYTISDADLSEQTADYRLLRLRRTSACTGPNGPGDRAWIWPAAVMVLLPLFIFCRRRSK